ncbi:MAG: NAD(P)H-binding protein [Bacteroidetes bacterium]|nr:NAD(P)H-binding protein [Bacteroidota bacterium]
MSLHAITGAFGFSGKYITRKLLEKNIPVITLTNSPGRPNDFGNKITVSPFHFDNPEKLKAKLKGVSVLYNTYWVRFNHKSFRHSEAVENTLKLFEAAITAGVKRIVHTSITNPDKNSPLEYFAGKGILEEALINSGISYSILRPAVLFGREDILVNNIAWMLRRFPFFGVFGKGDYKLQPIFVDDFAGLALREGENTGNKIIDAIGPETFTYRELAETVSEIILGKKRPVISLPHEIGYQMAKLVGFFTGDIVLTRQEITGLSSGLLCTNSPPAGKTKLTDWLKANKETAGRVYANELKRRRKRTMKY